MSRFSRLRLLGALSLAALVSAGPANAQSLREDSPQSLSEHSRRTQHNFDLLQARLGALAPLEYSGDTQREFRLASAKAWLAFAFDARVQRDNRTAAKALRYSTTLVERMEAQDFDSSSPAPDIAVEPGIATARLAAIEAMKSDASLGCAPAHVARLEVATLAAAHAHRLLGWRHARPYWLAADELAAQIALRTQRCKVKR